MVERERRRRADGLVERHGRWIEGCGRAVRVEEGEGVCLKRARARARAAPCRERERGESCSWTMLVDALRVCVLSFRNQREGGVFLMLLLLYGCRHRRRADALADAAARRARSHFSPPLSPKTPHTHTPITCSSECDPHPRLPHPHVESARAHCLVLPQNPERPRERAKEKGRNVRNRNSFLRPTPPLLGPPFSQTYASLFPARHPSSAPARRVLERTHPRAQSERGIEPVPARATKADSGKGPRDLPPPSPVGLFWLRSRPSSRLFTPTPAPFLEPYPLLLSLTDITIETTTTKT